MKNYSTLLRLILWLLCVASILVSAADTFAEPVIDWNVAMTSYSESLPPPGMPPFVEARVYAMAHIAMLRAITGNDADAARPFSKTAAIAQAAHDVLVDQFPGGASAFDNLLTKQLGAIADGPAKSAGVRLGARAAFLRDLPPLGREIVECSPEKAGVGGSTPSRGTIVSST